MAGFDNALGTGSHTQWGAGEGTDLCVRAIKSNLQIYLVPSILVFHEKHKIQPGNKDHINKAKSYAMGMGAILRKNRLSFLFVIGYFFIYFRALLWNVIRLKFKITKYHYSRIIGVIVGFIRANN